MTDQCRSQRISERRNALTRWVLPVLVVAMAFVGAACGSEAPENDPNSLDIVATTSIVGDIVSEAGPADAEVTVLMPAGADPHLYELTPEQVAEIDAADLVVSIGLGLEEGMQDELDAASTPIFELGADAGPLLFEETHPGVLTDEKKGDEDHGDEEHGDEDHGDGEHSADELDPHVWHDPTRMAAAVRALGTKLSDEYGEQADDERIEDYAQRLDELSADMAATLEQVPEARRQLVTDHASFGYFAEHFGWKIPGLGLVSGDTASAADPANVAEVADVVRTNKLPAVFYSAGSSEAVGNLMQTIADEAGGSVEVVELFAGSLAEDGDGATYVGMLEANAQTIADAMGGAK